MNMKLKRKSTPRGRQVVRVLDDRQRAKIQAPGLKLVKGKNNNVQVSTDHENDSLGIDMLMNAIGTTDKTFLSCLMTQLVNAGTQGKNYDGKGANFMLSVVKAIDPKDEIEAMLASQMAAVHMATMTFARRLAHVENIPQQDSAEKAFNKLARTFATQVETLKRYRTGGEQKVTVQHVNVSEGGQAIVGNVTDGRGVKDKSKDRPHGK